LAIRHDAAEEEILQEFFYSLIRISFPNYKRHIVKDRGTQGAERLYASYEWLYDHWVGTASAPAGADSRGSL
jgi:hypothetical protein